MAVCFIAVIMACIISVSVFAAHAAQHATTNIIQPYAVADGISSDDKSEILNSEDWEALLNVSSENSEPVYSKEIDVLESPLKTNISGDSFFIWGCIAIGLGVLGIAFFIYFQFIHKYVKKTTKTASYPGENRSKEVTLKRGDSFKEQVSKEKSQEKQDISGTSENLSQTQLNDVDWDKFFEEHKNYNNKDN